MNIRPRRLRVSENMRCLTRETRVSTDALIYPLFIKEGAGIKSAIPSLEGQLHLSPDRVCEVVEKSVESGVKCFLLFGLPARKDETGSAAWDRGGGVQEALRRMRGQFGREITLIADVCLCEYTSHGHCGVLNGETVDNDKTLPLLAKIAVSYADAGADIVAPSDMMDGRVRVIREALDVRGLTDVAILSYAVKYASSFYGPFREAAGSAPSFGDRKAYQMDYHNKREALKEAMLDTIEGADMLIVKPALAYADVIAALREASKLPLAAYSVSGEYAMIKSAAKAGLINEYGVMCESALSAFRAGADMLISYYANELAAAIQKGDIG